MSALSIGRIYRISDTEKHFPFHYPCGCFIGRTPQGWPRFMLDVQKGTECFLNAKDSCFVEQVR